MLLPRRWEKRESLQGSSGEGTVHDGEADVGLGIAAAAHAYGLGFVPLVTERYDLVFPEEAWATPPARAISEAVGSPGFASALASLGGYNTAETGREAWVGGEGSGPGWRPARPGT